VLRPPPRRSIRPSAKSFWKSCLRAARDRFDIRPYSSWVNREWAPSIGLASGKGFSEFKSLTDLECQEIIGTVEWLVFGLTDDGVFEARTEVQYAGGNMAMVSNSYLTLQGHELEERVKAGFPILRQYHIQGQLLMELIDLVIFDLRNLAPLETVQVFEEILEFEPSTST